MRTGDTIAAVASPPGRSARAILRLSGPLAHETLRALGAEPPAFHGDARPRCAAARIGFDGRTLPALCVWSRPPHSYTGEHTAEAMVPGNPHLVDRLLRALLSNPGVRHAEPGEFTARAFLNGRLTLDQAEAVGALIGARTQGELDAAHRLRAGAPGRESLAWLEEAATLLALVEAGIDFTDQEDVVPIRTEALAARLEALRRSIERACGPAASAGLGAEAPRVALVGAPNAGKSTLFNALLGKRRAVESDEAGTTRDVLVEPLDLAPLVPGAGEVSLMDLAGLDGALAARGALDEEAQRLAREAVARADVLICCDPQGRFREVHLDASHAAVIRIRTKADLPGETAHGALPVCALDGRGLDALRRAIADCAFAREARGASEQALIPRRRLAMARAARACAAAIESLDDPGAPTLTRPEIVAQTLREAVEALGELSGRLHPDDIIGRIFAAFCVGK